MMRRIFTPPFEMVVAGRRRRFRSAARLDAELAGRTALSSLRIAALGTLADDDLEREHEICRRLGAQVERAAGASDAGVTSALRALETAEVSDDNDWRAIVRAAAALGPEHAAAQRVVARRLREYLAACETIIEALRARHSAGGAQKAARESAPRWRQRLIFDLDELSATPGAASEREEFNRMPKGECLELELGPHQSLDLLLARHRFTLVAGEPFLLVHEHGEDLRLRRGKNIIGRSGQCDVVIDASLRAISRRHVIIEASGPGPVRITDISTIGTFLPRAFLDNRLH